MKAVFVEMPAFSRYRSQYLSDESFTALQIALLRNPLAGDVIQGAGGLRKIRWKDERRGKGKRGGLRIIYYWWERGSQCWLFTLYSKDDMADLSSNEKALFANGLKLEIEARK